MAEKEKEHKALYVLDTKEKLVSRLIVSTGSSENMKGMLGCKSWDNEEALMLPFTSSIHTFFMKFEIDVIFIDKNMKVKKIVKNLTPWNMAFCFGAAGVIEFAGGCLKDKKVEIGHTLVRRNLKGYSSE